jgi:hypothetical protein
MDSGCKTKIHNSTSWPVFFSNDGEASGNLCLGSHLVAGIPSDGYHTVASHTLEDGVFGVAASLELRLGVCSLGFWIQGLQFRVWDLGCAVWGLGFRVWSHWGIQNCEFRIVKSQGRHRRGV